MEGQGWTWWLITCLFRGERNWNLGPEESPVRVEVGQVWPGSTISPTQQGRSNPQNGPNESSCVKADVAQDNRICVQTGCYRKNSFLDQSDALE